MTWRIPIIGLSLASVIALAACGSTSTPSTGGTSPYSATPTATASAAASAAGASTAAASVIVTQNMRLGAILTDGQGRTLYQFLPEKGGKIVCTGACLTAWPPYLATSVSGGAGVTGRLAIITRPDGGHQVTYNTWPMYYFSHDAAPGQTNGQGIVAFGGQWLVATPSLQP